MERLKAPEDVIGWLEERSIPEPNTGCWLWLMGVSRYGYGIVNGRMWGEVLAHRVALRTKIGAEAMEGKLACHTCDQPGCVNPDHLYAGTRADNTADMVRRGRARGGKGGNIGENNPRAVLTDDLVRFLRFNVMKGDPHNGTKAWAKRLGVAQGTISQAVNGKNWRNVL